MKFNYSGFVIGTFVANAIQVEHEVCSHAVSLKGDIHNDHCMTLCEEISKTGVAPSADATFTAACSLAHYTIKNGRVTPDNSCFSNMVYGYSEGTQYDSIVPGLYYATPAMCQLACQENADCIHWTWASELVAGYNTRQRCLLKSADMVKGALAQDTSDPASLVNAAMCPIGTPASCTGHLKDCLKCEGSSRCAWESTLHVSGWKSCGLEVDSCKGDLVLPTEIVSQTFPGCYEYVSINTALLNDYCTNACNQLMSKGSEEALTTDKDFTKNCSHEHYTTTKEDSAAHPTGDCFNNVIIGYTETNNLGTVEDVQGLFVETPAQCQLHCQQHSDCAEFVFVTELVALTGSNKVHQCLIKSSKMVHEALNTNLAKEGVVVPTQYCNINMPYMCSEGGYDCLSCKSGETSCAWNSKVHIAGQPHCGSLKKSCEIA